MMKSRRWYLLIACCTILIAIVTSVPTPQADTESRLDVEPNAEAPSTEPSSEPATEPEGEPESEPEGEPEAEGEPEGEAEPEGGDDSGAADVSYAEPEPDWVEAKAKWGSAWEVHVYFFGVAFGIVALYSLFSVIRLWKRKHLLSQKYFISLNLLILLMGTTRSVYLLVDAYNVNGVFPELVAYIIYTIFLPSVTSAFSLLFISLLAATRMKFISPSIQKTKVILLVIIVHFVLAITADVLTVLNLDARIVLFICQLFYITWALFLFVGFMYIFGRLYKAAVDRQRQMNKYALKRLGSSNKKDYKPEQHKLTLSLATIVTLISSILGFLTVVLIVYGMVDVYGVFEDKTPEAWRWWGYHTAFRTLELAICITVSYVATQPFRYSAPTRRSSSTEKSSRCSDCFFFCAPCWSMCQREHSYVLSDMEWSELRSEVDSTVTLRRNESEKSDRPLNHVSNMAEGDVKKTSPDSSPVIGETAPAMPKADNESVHFSSEDRFPKMTEYITPM